MLESTPDEDTQKSATIVSSAYGTTYVKIALHLFSAFMLAAADASDGIGGITKVEELGSISKLGRGRLGVNPDMETINFNFKLHNPILANIIQGVQQSSVCSKSEAQFAVIAAVNAARKLPGREALIQ